MNRDIQVLPGNNEGTDKIIGDVHGGLTAFKKWLETIGENDRGFCVGDLIDRGEDSAGIILAIIEHNQNPSKGKVRTIRGNHEKLCLNALSQLEALIPSFTKKIPLSTDAAYIKELAQQFPLLNNAYINGGEWFIKLFLEEINDGLIISNRDDNETLYDDQSKTQIIKNFIEPTPYIIMVEGKNPFILTHADMPYDDKTVRMMARRNMPMSPIEKDYALWARMHGDPTIDVLIRPNGRTPYSIPVITGHNIVTESVPAIRGDTNTYDLDVCSQAWGSILSLNLKAGQPGECEWVGNPPNEFYTTEQIKIESQLFLQFNILENHIAPLRHCQTVTELQEYLSSSLSEETREHLQTLLFNYDVLSEEFILQAIANGELNILLKMGLDPNYTFRNGRCILQDAIENKNLENVTTILESGANPNLRFQYPNGPTALREALRTQNEDLIKAVLQGHLYTAILNKDHMGISTLVKSGADLFKVRMTGDTAFDLAISAGCYDHCLSLITIKAIPGKVPSGIHYHNLPQYGITGMHLAVLEGNTAKYERLCKSPKSAENDVAQIPLKIFEVFMDHRLKSIQNKSDAELMRDKLNTFYSTHKLINNTVLITPKQLYEITKLPELAAQPNVSEKSIFASTHSTENPVTANNAIVKTPK